MDENFIKLEHPLLEEPFLVHCFWLRDHCRCKSCYNFESMQRNYSVIELPTDVRPAKSEIKGDEVCITWNDKHESVYNINQLKSWQHKTHCNDLNARTPIHWNAKSIEKLEHARVKYDEYMKDDSIARIVIDSLVKYGVAFIESSPPNESATETAISRLFPIHKTIFGEMFTFSDKFVHNDTAYTKIFLGSHTDNTYFTDAAGLQILHCIEHKGTGGETFLVDTFNVLTQFKYDHPKDYDLLTRIAVPGEYIEGSKHFYYSAPIIKLNPISKQPEQVRFNLYDRAPFNSIPQNEMAEFYKALRNLTIAINDKENEWWFKLNPGTIMIMDNWRVLHGRNSYTGYRVMTGCYVSRSDYISVAHGMGLLSH